MDPIPRKAKNYCNAAGKSPFRDWIRKIDGEARGRISARIRRIEEFGNYGDCEPVGSGVYELKVNTGQAIRCISESTKTRRYSLEPATRTHRFRISRKRRSVGRATMPKRTSDFREELLADLRDPQEAAHYLNAAFEDSEQMALVALRDIAEARQMARIAEDAGVAREALYRMLSKTGNPTYESFTGVLNALGLRMVFVPIATTENDKSGNRSISGGSKHAQKANRNSAVPHRSRRG